ncbi:MarR family winged helix-turn-helix transcriptional regulator [Anaeromicropila herbilytica]|uniref:MarR family transcriptional regulator n=1 Tax=Anaeromicropila herbilytica TaxID=2785025 RepID=A0A7R7EML5_9FIRM|nr:MarR family transcriptional regulator [Anaeromicropila herbilytica]BCN31355.1 MarR family transcriptional regulator [Anaeromicropila herbilytica]
MKKKRTIGFEIKTVSNLIKRKIDEIVAVNSDHEITGMQGWIIAFLYDNTEHQDIFQRDLEKKFQIRRSTATGILQLLEKKQYIVRVPVDHDARLKKLVLTQKARELHERIDSQIEEFDNRLESELTKEEVEILFGILGKIRKTVE